MPKSEYHAPRSMRYDKYIHNTMNKGEGPGKGNKNELEKQALETTHSQAKGQLLCSLSDVL